MPSSTFLRVLANNRLHEISRVLRPGGILAGQIPNPYFPIESHSRRVARMAAPVMRMFSLGLAIRSGQARLGCDSAMSSLPAW